MVRYNSMFKKSIPTGLTPAQRILYDKIANQGYVLYCNEGVNYQCWLEKEHDNTRIPVNRRTANSLSSKGLISLDESFKCNLKFKMKLS